MVALLAYSGPVVVGVAQAGQDAVQSGSTGLPDGGPLKAVGQVGQIIEGAGCPAVPGHGLAVQGSGDEVPALNGGGHGVVSAAQCGAGVAVGSVCEGDNLHGDSFSCGVGVSQGRFSLPGTRPFLLLVIYHYMI